MDPTTFKYCPYYCEENIWHLCQEKDLKNQSSKVIFISNEAKQCAFSKQRASEGGFIVWDYHVILFTVGMIWDLDTTLPCPSPLKIYLEQTFPLGLSTGYQPVFRVVDSEEFVPVFASDRSHMMNQLGEYNAPPPWPVIGVEEGSNLARFIDMNDLFIGTIYRDISNLIGSFNEKKTINR